MSLIEIYIVAAVHLAAIPTVLYPMVYRSSPWRNGPTGRALMNMARSLALLFVIAIWGFWQPFGIYEYLYAAAVTYLGGATSYQLHVMWKLKRHAQRRRRLLMHYTLQERQDDEATQAVRPDDARR